VERQLVGVQLVSAHLVAASQLTAFEAISGLELASGLKSGGF
jgi:hypothetical protein